MRKLLFPILIISAALINTHLTAQTWNTQTSGVTTNLLAVQFIDANTGFACGDSGTVVRTIDGGTTWTSVNIATNFPVNDIFFVNANEGWAAVGDPDNSSSSGQIWHTTNGGTAWTSQTPSTTEARFGVCFANATTGWEVGSRNGPINVDATTNGGTSWTNQSDQNVFGWLYKIDAPSSSVAVAIGGAFFPSVTGFIIKTTNGGSTWSQMSTGTIPFLNGIDMADATTGFVVGDAGFIMTTANGGTTWTTQTSGTTDTLQDVSFVSTATGLVCGFGGTILRTINGGTAWTAEVSGITQNLNGIYSLDSTTAWAVGDGGKIIKRSMGTGINQVHQINYAVSTYPNPFTETTTISINAAQDEQFSFVLYDVNGKEVKRMSNIRTSTFIFNREGLANGIYTYRLIDSAETVVGNGKLIIN